jgi:hypothetical protein
MDGMSHLGEVRGAGFRESPMKLFCCLAMKLALAAVCLGVALTSAETVLTGCSEAALDEALLEGGRIVLTCSGTIPRGTTKVIAKDTELEAVGGQVVLSGSGSNRLFTINPGVTLTLRGLSLANGHHQGASGRDGAALEAGESGRPGFGGAVFNDGGTLVAVQVVFTTNTAMGGNGGLGATGQFLGTNGRDGGRGGAATGGAIQNRSGVLLLTNCTFVSNQAIGGNGGDGGDGADRVLTGNGGDGGHGGHGQGGAIHSEGSGEVVMVDCTFSHNLGQGGTGGEPGWAGGATTFDGSPGNAGMGEGGALYGRSGSVFGQRSTFNQNHVQGADGLDGLDGFDSRTGMDGRGGGAGRGGALAFHGAVVAWTNSTFFSNSATGGAGGDGGDGGDSVFGGDGGDGGRGGSARGGAVYHGSASVGTYVHCTFSSDALSAGSGGSGGEAGATTANRGRAGSTGLAEGANIATDSRMVELVFSILADGIGGPNSHGPVLDGGFNLSSDATPAFTRFDSLNEIDPLLSTFAQHGGPTPTIALSPDSPARDRSTDELLVEVDQRGYWRVDGQPDSGAFEFGTTGGLAIVAQGDLIIVSWPVSVPPPQLQSANSLVTPQWQSVNGAVQTGSVFVVTNSATGPARFYRLSE